MNDSKKTKSNRWKRWLLAILMVLCVAVIGLWIYAKSVAENRIEMQLLNLGLGKPKIGRVSVEAQGVTARQIEFYQPGEHEPWVSLDRMTIRHPLSGLVAGDEVFENLEIEGLRAIIDIDALTPETQFDFSTFEIPAKQLKLKNVAFVIRQSSRLGTTSQPREITVDQINGTISKTPTGFQIEAAVGDLSGGQWTAVGSAMPGKNQWNVELKTQSAQLVDGEWQNWPGLPNSIEDYFQANVEMLASIQLAADARNSLTYVAEIDLAKGSLNLPKFDLPLEITSGKLKLSDGLVRFENVVSTTDGKDKVTGFGSTTIDGFPLKSKFEAEFHDLDVATLRKLAPAVPIEVAGQATGKVTGTVDVEETLRTTIALTGNGISSNASYGSMAARATKVDIAITPLVIDSQQQQESLDGLVTVRATAKNLSANDVFDSLDLNGLKKQLEIKANASGEIRLDLPLATADRIETWGIRVSATAPRGNFSLQSARDIRVEANLADGNLHFTEIVATPVLVRTGDGNESTTEPTLDQPQIASQVIASVQWPLTSAASLSDTGKLSFEGNEVPAEWLVGLIDRQIVNAGVDSGLGFQPSSNGANLSGSINFQADIDVDANDPTLISKWTGEGTVTDSIAIATGRRLENLRSQLNLANGVLEYSQLSGEFNSGGNLSANGSIDIVEGRLSSTGIQTVDIPLSWVIGIAAEFAPDVKAILKDTEFALDKLDQELVGRLSAQFDLLPATAEQAWSIATKIDSDHLEIKGEPLSNVQLSGKFDAGTITVEKAHAEFNNRGLIDLSGKWMIAEKSGQADLTWQRLSLEWLSSFATSSNASVDGSTSGNVRVSKNDNAADGAIPITVAGWVNADGLQVAGLKSRRLRFDLRTEQDSILLERFRSEDDLKEVNLLGRLELKQPFAFSVDGTVEQLSLAKIFTRRSIADLEPFVSVTGAANAKFNLEGDLGSRTWKTTGEARLTQLIYNDQSLSDINAKWNHSGSNWADSKVSVNAFGGSVDIVELSQQPQRIKVELKDIDSNEFASFTKLPTKVTGKVSGDASFNDWSVATTRWAELNIRAPSMLVGPAEFGELQGSVEYRGNQLKYSIEGRFLNGKIAASGETNVSSVNPLETKLPVNVQLANSQLNQLFSRSNNFNTIRSLQGRLSANADWIFQIGRSPTGNGIVQINNLSWDNEILTKQVSTNLRFNAGALELSNLVADLQHGEISGRASIPITSNTGGSYQLNLRGFNLQRLLDVLMADPIEGAGLLDARVSGKIGRSISGQGTIAIRRAKALGLAGRTFQVPIQFQFQPQQNTGRIAIRQSRFQIFNGNVAGLASLEFGPRVSFEANLQVVKLDTERLFASLASYENAGQGDLSGQLILKGKSIRSWRDLKGSFKGRLDRVAAFELPLMAEVGRFLGGTQFQSRDFESDDIDLRLSQGKVEIRSLSFTSSLAQIAVTGNAFLDGRLDLSVAGKINRLNQPTLLDQIAGSPLAQFQGSPLALFAQAAEFLSERLVFVKISGTFRRPLVRPDSGKQLQSEAIRYFLRGSQILPNTNKRNK